MNRYLLAVAAVTFFVAADRAAAQGSPAKSLAQRFGQIREGWSFSSDKADEPTPAAAASGSTATASDLPDAMPRVNSRELMPRKWFGVGVEEVRQARQANPPASAKPPTVPQNGSLGSARARLLRDMRRPMVQVEGGQPPLAELARRPTPRAGSALSPNAPQINATGPASVQKERLNEAIAAEVAQSMAQPEPTEADGAATEPDADVIAEGPTPTETNSADEQPADSLFADDLGDETTEGIAATESPLDPTPSVATAEGDAGRVRVAENPAAPTKLPLFIGNGYKSLDEPVSVEAVTSTPSDEAAEAFSAAPQKTPAAAPVERVAQATPAAIIAPRTSVEPEADDFLLTQSLPVLVSRVGGPRTIVVGREANYRVLLANRGDVQADQVVTEVKIPEWAEVVSATAGTGKVETDGVSEQGLLVWRADNLPAGEVIKLDLRLVARQGKPIELGVTHRHRPLDGRTMVEVQEPMLALEMMGPDDVLFGKPQTYRLTISNPGTGTAENVKLSLTPPGGDAQRRTQHDFGALPAGEQRTVEIELTAREAGNLAIDAAAKAEGDVTAAITKKVFCRRPKLIVDWRGPSERYSGAPAVYYFRVRNPGTADAPEVTLKVELPEGFEVQAGAGTPAVEAGKMAFQVGTLAPEEERFFELRGVLRTAGANLISLQANDSGETQSERVTAETEVIALADLKLDVLDPRGPIATGQEAEYQIRVTNRGSSAAREVAIVGLFSDGIEPHHVAGAEYTINDGRVAFETIKSMAVGEERVFTIHARAHEAGAHLFRAEVVCRDLDIKLAAEETTRFFEDESIDVAGDGYPRGPSRYPR